MNNTNCLCCGWKRAEINVSFKPENMLFRVALCSKCFDVNKINAEFLKTCLEHGTAGNYGKFKELRSDAKQENPLDDLAA